MMSAMKTPMPFTTCALVLLGSGSVAYAVTNPFADFSPEISKAMDEEQAAFAETIQTPRFAAQRTDPTGERAFVYARTNDCLGNGVVSGTMTYGKALSADPKATSCWLEWTRSRTQTLRQATEAAKAGAVSVELAMALKDAKRQAYEPAPVDPLSGTNARIEHAGSTTTLTYTDSGGTSHEYAVARPKFAQGIVQGDAGGWMYLAPDHKSGIMFNMGANAQVTGKPANPMMLQMMSQ